MKKTLLLLAFSLSTFILNAQISSCTAFYTYISGGMTVNFADSSYGTELPTSFYWSFGDGFTETVQNPVHTYSQAGTYYVCLTASALFTSCQDTYCDSVVVSGSSQCVIPSQIDSSMLCTPVFDPVCGCDSVTYNNSCEAYYYGGVSSYTFGPCGSTGNCTASFWYMPDSINADLIYFTDFSFPSPASWLWDFGDGTSDSLQNPAHLFPFSGTYYVCLTITDSTGCSNTYCEQILVGNQAGCSAYFMYSPDSLNPLTFNFADSSYGTPTDWYWDFGDGDSSLLQNPSHTFDSTGWFTVCLTIIDSVNNCTNFYCQYIEVSNCYASFIYAPDSVNPNNIHFGDNSSLNTTGWFWDFGDSITSNLENPDHTYLVDGWYYVCLVTTDSLQNCTSTSCNYIYAGFMSTCSAYYFYTPDSANPLTINFSDYSSGSPSSWNWDFGTGDSSSFSNPSYTFDTAGFYLVCLYISDSTGSCDNTFCDYVTVGNYSSCQALFTYSNPFGNLISFTDSSSGTPTAFFWDFGDGTNSSQQNPFHNYPDTGAYYVCLTITDANSNCNSTICTIVYLGTQPPSCTANFTYSVTGNVVVFSDNSTGTPSNYVWNFGDGNNGTQPGEIHTYTDSGFFNVCLTIIDLGTACYSQFCDSIYIAPSPGGCTAGFTYTAFGDSVEFNDNSTGNPVAWSWDFGEFFSQPSSLQNPSHTFNTLFFSGFNVCLTITAANGCYDTFCDSVVIVGTYEPGIFSFEMLVYPNPNDGKFEVSIPDELNKLQKGEIEISNVLGEKIFSSSEVNPRMKVDLSGQPSGVYFINIVLQNQAFQKKLLLVK